jgi:hypothetical protein
MMPQFRDLGERLGVAWRAAAYDERAFPELAALALHDSPPDQYVGISDICAWLLDPARHIAQPAMNPFGQPPVLVFSGQRFRIEALFWRESTTSIHQHSFAGAFTVLGGASFHSTFDFVEEVRVNTRIRFGQLTARDHEILRPGDVRAIRPGPGFIHQVTHLDVPTVSIVVRTEGFAEHRPQLYYELPGVALDPDEDDHTLLRRLAVLDLLCATRRDQAIEVALRWIEAGDLESIYRVVIHLAAQLTTTELSELDTRLVERHGWVGERIREACHHRRRVHATIAARTRTRDPKLRLLIATLMLGCSPAQVCAILGAHTADAGGLEDRVLELARDGAIGLDHDEITDDLVRALLRGATPETLVDALADDYELDELEAQRADLIAHARRIASVPLLAHLFDLAAWSASAADARRLQHTRSDA